MIHIDDSDVVKPEGYKFDSLWNGALEELTYFKITFCGNSRILFPCYLIMIQYVGLQYMCHRNDLNEILSHITRTYYKLRKKLGFPYTSQIVILFSLKIYLGFAYLAFLVGIVAYALFLSLYILTILIPHSSHSICIITYIDIDNISRYLAVSISIFQNKRFYL